MGVFSKVRVLDGGFGTELESCNFKISGNKLWSAAAVIDRPDLVIEVHKRFINAGSNIILTNTYHANIKRIMDSRSMSKDEAIDIIKKAVSLAYQAAEFYNGQSQERIEVIGSVGPYATTLVDCSEYNGHYVDEVETKLLVEHHIEQSLPLLESGLKMLAYETVPAIKEVEAILTALNSLPHDMQCWISISCKNSEQTNHGDSFVETAKLALSHPKVFGLGINCTAPEFVTPLIKSIQNHLNEKILIVYPNSGEKYDTDLKRWTGEGATAFNQNQIKEWVELGVKVIGGCCRVKPMNIENIAKIVFRINHGT